MSKLQGNGTDHPTLAQIHDSIDGKIGKYKLRVALSVFKTEQIVREHRGSKFDLIKRGLPNDAITRAADSYTERGMSDRDKLERIMLYAQSAFCRWQLLSEYFETGDKVEHCGTCDNCRQPVKDRLEIETPEKRATKAEEEKILKTINGHKSDQKFNVGDLVEFPNIGDAEVKEIDGDKLEVVLPNGERRTFKSSFAKRKKR